MWFDAQAELTKLAGERENDTFPPATIATSATPRARVAIVADVATPSAPDTKSQTLTAGGRVATWTGRVVSLDEWRTLTAWDQHGPDRRHWCGISQRWE